jgi:hypothetical protein
LTVPAKKEDELHVTEGARFLTVCNVSFEHFLVLLLFAQWVRLDQQLGQRTQPLNRVLHLCSGLFNALLRSPDRRPHGHELGARGVGY